ncbi:non-ribosomal peptide synthetase [Streptomyces sp. NPDC018045]|uniref:non-ribosomal peptide synthetase n=1 Tax=Streptomyces sp. NPDC018045 TaxID=3365037 RepID=UPI0037A5F169
MRENKLTDDGATSPAGRDVVLLHRLDGATSYHQAQRMGAALLHGVPEASGPTCDTAVGPVFTYSPRADLRGAEPAAAWCRDRLTARRAGHGTDALMVEEALWSTAERGFALALITGREQARRLLECDSPVARAPAVGSSWWSPVSLEEAGSVAGRKAEPADWDVLRLLTSAPDDRHAVTDEHGALTYGELRAGAFAVARHLKDDHGVRPGDRIALVGGRDAATATCILGAWLAGAAWCAVDRELPRPRRESVLGALLPQTVLDTASVPASSAKDAPARTVLAADAVAYFVATSGSTGTPKLSALPAGGLRPLLDGWSAYYGLNEPHRVLQIGSWEGDVFLGDLLKALESGGTLVICPQQRRSDPEFLARTVVEQDISFAETTPTLMRALMRALGRRKCGLRVAVVGSDTFRMEEARELSRLVPAGTRLVNGYGLTECMIESVVYDCAALMRTPGLEDGLCPLGAPLPGTAVRVVHPETGRVLPRGVVGELVIDSPGVGLGYVGADGPVAEGGFAGEGFRTGDQVSLDADGLMHFHGRSDSRVKVRGHRVELGDVENALLRVPGVAEAYVSPFERSSVTELAAFVASPAEMTEAFVRSELLAYIPAAIVPVRFHLSQALPRLPNGKLDRRAMKVQNQQNENFSEIPEDLPGRIRYCWESVLGRPVATGSTFFDQGGTSLLVITLAELLRETLGPEYEFSVADLFRWPTIDTFASALHLRAEPHGGGQRAGSAPERREMLQALAQGNASVEEVLERIHTS